MQFQRQITRVLHEEHVSTLALCNRVEEVLAKVGPKGPPAAPPAGLDSLLRELAAALPDEVAGHFAFEEEELFPRLAEFGDADIGAFLMEEHESILPLGRRLGALAGQAAREGFGEADWREFHRLGAELAERMMSHIQKEEMGLLPVLDDMLDDDTDRALAGAYMMRR